MNVHSFWFPEKLGSFVEAVAKYSVLWLREASTGNTCPYMLIVSYFEAHSTASFNISSVCQLPCTHIQHYHFYVFLVYGFVNTIAKRGSPLLQFLVVCANFVVNVAVNFVVF